MTTNSANDIGRTTQTTVGALTVGSLAAGFTVVTGALGGTGVANTGSTITLGANLTTTPANALTLTTRHNKRYFTYLRNFSHYSNHWVFEKFSSVNNRDGSYIYHSSWSNQLAC